MPADRDDHVVNSEVNDESYIAASDETALEEEWGESAEGVTETVLVVDDDRALRNFVTNGLRMQGYRILTAANGLQALHLAQVHPGPIDALVTDIDMPYLDGKELAFRLKAVRPHVKVLLMSGGVWDEATEVMAPEAVFLQKPFSQIELGLRLRQALDHKGNELSVIEAFGTNSPSPKSPAG